MGTVGTLAVPKNDRIKGALVNVPVKVIEVIGGKLRLHNVHVTSVQAVCTGTVPPVNSLVTEHHNITPLSPQGDHQYISSQTTTCKPQQRLSQVLSLALAPNSFIPLETPSIPSESVSLHSFFTESSALKTFIDDIHLFAIEQVGNRMIALL